MLSPGPRQVLPLWTDAIVLAMVVTPLLGAWLLAEELRSISGLATVSDLVVFPTALGASILLYVQYRLTGSDVTGWTTICLTQYSVQGIALAGLRAADPDAFFNRAGWVLIIDVPAALLILGCLRLSDRAPLAVDPLVTGLLLGMLVAVANLAANSWGDQLSMTSPPVVAAQVALVLVGVGIAHAAYHLEGIPRWYAVRLGLGAIALVANRIASTQDATGTVEDAVAVVTGVLGAVLMVSAAGAGLRYVISEQRSSLATLTDHLAELEADERDNRARLHEITNSIAGIAVASSLLHQEGEVPTYKRRKLERMLESEAGRLSRILAGKGTDALSGTASANSASDPAVVDLDEVIGPLVTAQQTLGRQVDWQPTGHRGHGDPDAVAEVVHILLDNAARHAPGSRTSIQVNRHDGKVEVAVCDDGPGIAAEVRPHLFEWGGRGPDSDGQGIGLHLAQRLMTATGNSLHLESKEAGVAFVIGLPAAEETPT